MGNRKNQIQESLIKEEARKKDDGKKVSRLNTQQEVTSAYENNSSYGELKGDAILSLP